MKLFRKLQLYVLLLSPLFGYSQSDSLTVDAFYHEVWNNHPIAKQARLLVDQGRLTVQQARGQFDPKIVADYNSKNQGGKDYYSVWQSYVQVPTLLNVDIKAGFESSNGLFLNPENTTPTDGLYYAGLTIPLGQGLIQNPRNVILKKSRFEEQNLQNQSTLVLNNLLLEANFVYWSWYENYQKNQVVTNNLNLVTERYNYVRESVKNGENAAIDSIETLIQVQLWQNNLSMATLDLTNSMLSLNNYIWSDSIESENSIPGEASALSFEIDTILDQIATAHPELIKLFLKSEMLTLDRKLSTEQLKPVLNLNYNFLRSPQGGESFVPFTNDYKMGIQFAFPLFLRKERAKLKLAKLKIQDNDLQITEKNRVVLNKIQQAYNKVLAIDEMIVQQVDIVRNYQVLLNAERTKFNNGESSVFLLNSRENKKLENEIKLIELKAKYGRAIGELKWAAGILYSEVGVIN